MGAKTVRRSFGDAGVYGGLVSLQHSMNSFASAPLRKLLVAAAFALSICSVSAANAKETAPLVPLVPASEPVRADSAVSTDASSTGKPVLVASKPAELDQVAVGDFKVLAVKVGVGSLSPQERARYVSQRLLTFAQGDVPPENIAMQPDPNGFKIVAGVETLLVLSQADATATGRDLEPLAKETFENTRAAVTQYRESRSFSAILKGMGLTLLSIAALSGLIWLVRRGFEHLNQAVPRAAASFGSSGIQIKNTPILSIQRIEALMHSALGVARILAIVACLYFFLPLILSFFPVTRAIGKRIFELFLTPLETIASSLVNYIPNFFYILVIILIAVYTLRATSFLFSLLESGDLSLDWFYKEWAKPTYQIIRALIIVMAAISAFPYIPGSGSPAFQGVGLVLGLVVSFASSSAISNVVAGIILVYTRAFRVGDRIKINDTVGDVVEKTLLVTRVITPKKVVITIPNSLVLGTHILNFSRSASDMAGPGLLVHTTITIGYDVAWSTVERLMIEAARRTDGLLTTPPAFVLQTSLDDFYVAYEVNAYTQSPQELPRLYSDLHRHIQDTFNEAAVEILSPHYRAQRDGNASTVPSVLGQANYQPPRFRVDSTADGK